MRFLPLLALWVGCGGEPFTFERDDASGGEGGGGQRASDGATTTASMASSGAGAAATSSSSSGSATSSSSSSGGAAPCGPSTCNGCCSDAGDCLAGDAKEACGLAGAACIVCKNTCKSPSQCAPSGQPAVQERACIDHACEDVSYPMCCFDTATACVDETGECG